MCKDAEVWTAQAQKESAPLPIKKAANPKDTVYLVRLTPDGEQITDNSKIFETLLKAEGANVNLTKGSWNAGVHFLAARCNDYNIPLSEAERMIWNYANTDNTGHTDALKTIRSAYRQPSDNKEYNLPSKQNKAVKRAKNEVTTVKNEAVLFSKDDGIIYDIISEHGIFLNELTAQAEFTDGTDLTDNDINTIALKARVKSKEIGNTAVTRILFSDYTPKYHPFAEYIKNIQNLPLKLGTVTKYLNCLELEADHNPEYKERIIKKWFGGLMGTLMGSYSVMTLVFVGGQRTGKTTFFRNLLPPALSKYFAESEITDDKDIMARMCSNLIVYNDEFTSKNKTEASEFKKMCSADKFTYRKPYGRLDVTNKRTAVLCGSANEPDVISDNTGNRRVIPSRITNIDHEALKIIPIDDFYRELLEMHKDNPTWWHLSPDDIDLMNADTVQNTAVDEDEERIMKWTEADEYGHVSTTEVAAHIANWDKAYRPNVHKLGRALNRVRGSSVQKRIGTGIVRGYKIKLVPHVPLNNY